MLFADLYTTLSRTFQEENAGPEFVLNGVKQGFGMRSAHGRESGIRTISGVFVFI